MTATQTSNGNNNKPKRQYRSSDEVKEARLKRQADLIARREARAARLKAEADAAAKKLAETKAKEKEIATHEPKTGGRKPSEPVPTIREAQVTRFSKALGAAAKELAAEHGLQIEDVQPRIVHRGTGLSIAIRGGVAGVKQTFRKAKEASREALRFASNHKLIGLSQRLLNREVQLKNEDGTFKVIGLKGRANDVVLQKVGSDDFIQLAADDFKARLVEAAA